ncbi:ATPase, T2SS/T4P/T4SS family [Tepidicaulis sp. LMO-SS28]|uniref:ATPase, T2SS/T4P/T4SS family n=1 Tax=Tepidicaulis sp. LMO-SS28 TaxID=3447455 RepID=UPI003EDED49F
MPTSIPQSETASRGARMLRTALGPAIGAYLSDPSVVEVMLNPDGRLWIDRLSGSLEDTGERLPTSDGERIIHHVGAEVHTASPRVSAESPGTRERLEGLLLPIVAAPAVAVFTLAGYVVNGIVDSGQANAVRSAVATRRNILVAGGTSTGKTMLTNTLLMEVAKTADRIVLIEDTCELQCAAPNLVAPRTKDGIATLSDLVRSSLRLRPVRLPIGEVRGAEAHKTELERFLVDVEEPPPLLHPGSWQSRLLPFTGRGVPCRPKGGIRSQAAPSLRDPAFARGGDHPHAGRRRTADRRPQRPHRHSDGRRQSENPGDESRGSQVEMVAGAGFQLWRSRVLAAPIPVNS